MRAHNQVLYCTLISLFLFISCSSSEKTASSSFDAKSYYNPYNLDNIVAEKLRQAGIASNDSTADNKDFTFAKLKARSFKFSVVQKVSSPHPLQTAHSITKDVDILFKLYIDQKGRVKKITMLRSSDPTYASSAKKSLYNASFEPGKLKGKPVKSILRIPVSF